MVFMCGHIYIYTYYLSTNIQRVAATSEHTNIAEDLFSSKMNDIECERRLIWGETIVFVVHHLRAKTGTMPTKFESMSGRIMRNLYVYGGKVGPIITKV